MEITPSPLLRKWLTDTGHAAVLDSPIQVDENAYGTLIAECCKLHPDYEADKCRDWALYSVITRPVLSKAERDSLQSNEESAQGVARVAKSVEAQGKKFAGMVDGFSELNKGIGALLDAETATATAISTSAKSIADTLAVSTRVASLELAEQIDKYRTQCEAIEQAALERERVFYKWDTYWRIALFVAILLGIAVIAVHAEPTPKVRQPLPASLRGFKLYALPQFDSPIIRVANGGSTLATRGAGLLVFNCSTGMVCSWTAATNTFTLTSSGVGGSGCTTSGATNTLQGADGAGGCTPETNIAYNPASPSSIPPAGSSSGQIPIWDSGASAYVPGDPLVQGLTAHDAVGTSTNPVAAGGFASAAAPTAVSADGDIVRSWHLRNGAQVFQLSAAGALIPGDATDGLKVQVTTAPTTAVTGPLTDTQLRATPVPVSGTVTVTDGAGALNTIVDSGSLTANAGTNLNTSALALEAGGNLASIKAKTDNIPALGQALAAASAPVVLTAAQITTLTPPAAITNFANETGGNLASSATSLGLIDDTIFVDDTATHATGTTKVIGIGAVAAPTDTAVNANDIGMPGMTVNRELYTSVTTALPAGANVIGHVIADTGSTTAVTGTVTVTGPLTDTQLRATPVPVSGTVTVTDGAGALNVIVDSGSTVVTQPTGTNLHAVLDTTSTTAVTQATGTNLHAVIDSGAVTVSDGSGALNVIVDSGTSVVTQPTGTNLHAVLDTTSTTAVTQATGTNLHAVLDTTSTTAVTQATGTNLHAVIDSGSVTVSDGSGALNTIVDSGTLTAVTSITNTVAAQGTLTNDSATPSTNNLGVLPCLANTSAPTPTSGRLSTLSCLAANGAMRTDVTTLGGAAFTGNVGNATNGTIRVVLATDQPALTNALSVSQATASNLNATVVGGTTPADGESNPTTAVSTESHLMGWNNSTWDRVYVESNGNDAEAVRTTGNLSTESHPMAFNGTTWDRARSANIGNNVPSTGLPIAVPYCQSNTTLPTTASASYTAVQCDLYGRQIINDPKDDNIIAALSLLLQAQQNVRVRGTFGETLRSVNGALAVMPIQADPCSGMKQSIAISQTANTKYVVGVGRRTYVCSIFLVGADAEGISIVEGTGTTCGTGTLAVIGGATAAAGPNMAANGGFTLGNGQGTIAASNIPGNDICVFESASGRVAGVMTVAFGQ